MDLIEQFAHDLRESADTAEATGVKELRCTSSGRLATGALDLDFTISITQAREFADRLDPVS